MYASDDCIQLKGPEIVSELKHFLRLLTMCMLFSKKPFPVFLESSGYTEADVLLQKPKAGVSKCFLFFSCEMSGRSFAVNIPY